jgi:hypothetical protein
MDALAARAMPGNHVILAVAAMAVMAARASFDNTNHS